MEQRFLGNAIAVSAIGLGCMGMDHAYGAPAARDAMQRLLQQALDLGCTFFDTAVVYGTANEELLGKSFVHKREQVVLATKFGIIGQKIVAGQPVNILDSKPQSIRQQVEASLRRLQSDYIDLYYQHRIDPHVEPERVAEVMAALIQEGKIRAWGLSNAPLDYLYKAHAICPLAAVQNQYSMLWREPEQELFDVCAKLNIAFVAYSPLGNGFLSGRFHKDSVYAQGDFRRFMRRFSAETMQTNQALLALIRDIAQQKHATPAQIVLAWELAQRPFIIPIPGTTNPQRLQENLNASTLSFTAAEHNAINAALAKLTIDASFF